MLFPPFSYPSPYKSKSKLPPIQNGDSKWRHPAIFQGTSTRMWHLWVLHNIFGRADTYHPISTKMCLVLSCKQLFYTPTPLKNTDPLTFHNFSQSFSFFRISLKTIYLAAYSGLFDKHSTLCPVDSSHLRKAVESVLYQITPAYSCMNVCFRETIRWPMVRFFTHMKHKMIQVSILKIGTKNSKLPPQY